MIALIGMNGTHVAFNSASGPFRPSPVTQSLIDVVASITEETLRRKASGQLDKSHMKSVRRIHCPALWTDAIFKFFTTGILRHGHEQG